MTDLFLVPFSGVGFGEGMDHPVHRGDTMSIGLHDRYCPMCVSFSRLYLPCVQLLMLNIRDCPPKKKQQGKKKTLFLLFEKKTSFLSAHDRSVYQRFNNTDQWQLLILCNLLQRMLCHSPCAQTTT